jgi:ER degradation enhancer, mannosidase alpha-like 3
MLDFMRSCPSPNKLFPETVRGPLRDLVKGVCPGISSTKRLRANDFQASNQDHLRTVYDMGITMVALADGKVQLLHSFYNVSYKNECQSLRFKLLFVFFIYLRPSQQKTQNEV